MLLPEGKMKILCSMELDPVLLSVCSWPAEGALAPVAEELLEQVRLRLSNGNLHKCIRIISVHEKPKLWLV